MGGFLGIGNSSAKTDRGNQLAGVNASWNVYNTGLPLGQNLSTTGQSTTQAGVNGLQQAQQYWQNLMSGNRQSVMKAAAPAISSVNEQADAQRRAQAQTGTARGGGTAALNQEAETNRTAQVNNLVGGLQAQAPQQEAQVSQAETGVGAQQMQEALQALGLDEGTAAQITNSSITSRPQSLEANPLNGIEGGLASTLGTSVDSTLGTVLSKAMTALGF